MQKEKIVKIFFILFSLIFLLIFLYSKILNTKEVKKIEEDVKEETVYKSNIIENVNYTSNDAKGNEYIINALQGEIDYSNPNILFLTDVKALIKLNDEDNITITSDFGKYNTQNYDTIFSKNVIIKYMNNVIKGQYLDFSLVRDSMIISKEITYTNFENILTADVIEIDIKSKDTKIFMYENKKKVNIKSIK